MALLFSKGPPSSSGGASWYSVDEPDMVPLGKECVETTTEVRSEALLLIVVDLNRY